MKKSKLLVFGFLSICLFALGACGNKGVSSEKPSEISTSSITQVVSDTRSEDQTTEEKTEVPTSEEKTENSTAQVSSEEPSLPPEPSSEPVVVEPHICGHVCPIDNKCLDDACKDDACKEKCPGHSVATGFTLEAEKGAIEGTMTGTAADDAFVGERTSNNSEHPTSGGKVVFNWAAKGNTVTWTIKVTEKETAKLTLWACAGGNQASAGLGLSVNDQSASWKEDTVLGKGFSNDQWYYWNPITSIVELEAGTNVIKLTNVSGESWNLDCLSIEKYVAPTHTCTSVCPICGKCTDLACTDPVCADKCAGHIETKDFVLEAENGIISGTMTGTAADDAFVGERTSNNTEHPTSNGKVVFNWAAKDNKITWYVNSDKAYSDVRVTLWCCAAGDQASSGLVLSVNGTNASWKESTVLGKGFSDNQWYYWNPITTTVSLAEGLNTLVLTNNSGESWNLDCIVLAVPSTSNVASVHLCGHVCDECGLCKDPNCTDPACAEKCTCVPPHVCGHVCETCGKCLDAACADPVCADKCEGHAPEYLAFVDGKARIEAESFVSQEGGASIANKNETEEVSGDKYVGDFNYGKEISYTINLESETTAEIIVCYACGINGNDNGAVEVWVNGVKVGNYGNTSDWHAWETATTKAVELNAGENTITLKGPYGSYTNLDYIIIRQLAGE